MFTCSNTNTIYIVHIKRERACIGTACCFIPFINSCEKNMLKIMHVSKTVDNC